MVDVVETRQNELKTKKICRFCLTQNEANLSSIFSRDSGVKNAPLPLQVMACVSIEVFSDECMPSYVCNECRLMFDYCYRFKQMCKKADTCLRHYPLTGVWSPPMKKPKMSWNSVQTPAPVQKTTKIVVEKVEEEDETSDTILTMLTEIQSYLHDEPEQREEVETAPEPVQLEEPVKPKPLPAKPVRVKPAAEKPATEKPSQKLLNKSVIRILNKDAQQQANVEPRMTKPRLKRDEDGNLAIVTEILEMDAVAEPNPVENAAVIETNVFPCPHCERSFPLRQLLDIHMVNHNRERSFNCTDCEKSFFSKYDLQKHMLVHTGEKPFKCVVCDKGFTRSTLLHRHEKIHTDIPKYICVFCEKPFISQEEMEKHTERHRKVRPFSCKICQKSFAFKQGLERHEVVHCRFQPYQCQYCDQSFSTPSKLSRHLTAHAGARPYPCKLCPKAYLLSHHLTRHMRSHKNASSSYKCNDCDKTFAHRDDLMYHSAVHATQTLICPLCKDVLNDVEAVTEHVKQHADGESYACEFCDLIFMTAERLQDHTDTEHADDMVAYNEDDKRNETKEKTSPKGEKSNDTSTREVDEVIEEFLYDEFSDSGENKSSNMQIKEETEWQVQSGYSKTQNDEESNAVEEAVEYLDVIERSESTDAPPAKIAKLNESTKQISKKASPVSTILRHKAVARPQPTLTPAHPKPSLPKENKKPNPKPAAENRVKTEMRETVSQQTPKTRQPTIQAALQGLPRSLSVKKVGGVNKPNPSEQKEIETPKVTQKVPSPSGTVVKQVAQPTARPLRQRPELKKTPPKLVQEPVKKSPSTENSTSDTDKKIVEMVIGDKRVKVQKITMSKAQAVAMAREGRIQMKEGTMILKKNPNQIKVVRKS